MRRLALASALAAALLAVLLVWKPWHAARPRADTPTTIVLFTVDTLRRDRVGVYGRNAVAQSPLTPRMDAVANAGVRFDDARTPVPLTLSGHTVMLAGLPPAATGVRLNAYGRIPPAEVRGWPLLAERLGAAGWRTAAFVSAASLLAVHGLDQGFEVYDDDGLDETPPGLGFHERPGETAVDRALAWLDGLDAGAPAFVWVHIFEPHAPYAPELPRTTPTEVRYDADVARADAIVGRLLDGLDVRGRGDSAALLLTADHGEALDELGERTHGYLLGDATLRVPFLLKAPGITPAVRDEPVDLADVAPTLAGLAGLPWPHSDVPGAGRDLLASPVPPDRLRVAESLYAHQRYGWAQLAAVVTPAGDLLVDAGGDRLLWLEPAPLLEPQAHPQRADQRVDLAAYGACLRAYRSGERKDLLRGGGVAGGYGSGAQVAPFLASTLNGRLPNPYDRIPGVAALDTLAHALREGAEPRAVLARLRRMDADDPGNPEIAFRRGRAWERRAARTGGAEDAAAARREAAAAYLEAWQRGRRDAGTLGLAVGVDAAGQEADALKRLRTLAVTLPPDARLALLEARLCRSLGRDEEAEDACARAAEWTRRPWERKALERARADTICR